VTGNKPNDEDMMDFDTIIRGGTIATAADTFACDVGIKDGAIAALGANLGDAAEIVDAASFIAGPNEEVVKAGTALTAFAVCLDDLIDGEAHDLFPMIQRSLLANTNGS